MKKTFRTILAGAFAFLAVSCYDDSALKKQNDLLKEELENLKESLVDASELGLSRDNFFVGYGLSKSVELTATEGMEYEIITTPDGWDTELDGTTLTVHAPSKLAVGVDAFQKTGEIILHASSNGNCKIAKLSVSTGIPFEVSADAEHNVKIFNAFTSYEVIDEMGNMATMFGDAQIGVVPAAIYAQYENFDAFFAAVRNYDIETPYGFLRNIKHNYYSQFDKALGVEYEEGVAEEDSFTITLEELGKLIYGFEYDPEEDYVVWAVPQTTELLVDDASYDATGYIVGSKATSVAWNNICATLNLGMADSYCVSLHYVDSSWEVTNEAVVQEGVWNSFLMGYAEMMGAKMFESGICELDFSSDFYQGDALEPGSKYLLSVIPMIDGKAFSDYNFDTDCAPYIQSFETLPLQSGSESKVALSLAEVSYYSMSFSGELSGNASFIKYQIFEKDQYGEMSDNEKVEALLSSFSTYEPDEFEGSIDAKNLKINTTYVLAVLVVDQDGKYGVIETAEGTTLNVEDDENIKLTVESVTEIKYTEGEGESAVEKSKYSIACSVSGATKICYYQMKTDQRNSMKSLLLNNNSQLKHVDVEDGNVTFEVPKDDYKTGLNIMAYNIDVNGKIVSISTTDNMQFFQIADRLSKE